MPTIHRFFVQSPILGRAGDTVGLPSHVAHQASAVLRMRPGDPLELFDGRGGEWLAEIAAVGRGAGEARLTSFVDVDRESPWRLTLCLALIKADRFEWALQKGTELGVSAFQPMLTRRVTGASGRGTPAQREREHALKAERWRRIVIEAAEQSERTLVPAVRQPRAFSTVLKQDTPSVLLWESAGDTAPFHQAIAHLRARGAGAVQVLIGPEGGYTPEEVQAARESGALVASLGPRIVRSETAAVAAAALTLLGGRP